MYVIWREFLCILFLFLLYRNEHWWWKFKRIGQCFYLINPLVPGRQMIKIHQFINLYLLTVCFEKRLVCLNAHCWCPYALSPSLKWASGTNGLTFIICTKFQCYFVFSWFAWPKRMARESNQSINQSIINKINLTRPKLMADMIQVMASVVETTAVPSSSRHMYRQAIFTLHRHIIEFSSVFSSLLTH